MGLNCGQHTLSTLTLGLPCCKKGDRKPQRPDFEGKKRTTETHLHKPVFHLLLIFFLGISELALLSFLFLNVFPLLLNLCLPLGLLRLPLLHFNLLPLQLGLLLFLLAPFSLLALFSFLYFTKLLFELGVLACLQIVKEW